MSDIAGLIRLQAMRDTAAEGIRAGRQLQLQNRGTIADKQRENIEIEQLIAENYAAIAELDALLARIRARLPLEAAAA